MFSSQELKTAELTKIETIKVHGQTLQMELREAISFLR